MNSGRTRINILGRLLVSAALFASSALAQTLTTPNRTLPHFDPPRTSLEFSESPTDEEISRARAFEEPLVPIGGKPTAQENSDLAAALLGYAKRSGPDDFASLTGFLDAHPNSPWAAALLTDLGLEYYNTAHYSLALDVWTKAWSLARQARDAQGRALADRAVAELAQMDARLGRMTELDALLKSVASRTLIGSANQKIDDARDGLWTMQNRPEVAFRCGPLALRRIKLSVDPKNPGTEEIYKSASTQHGFSLPQVAELSTKIGLNYQMAFRGPDGAFVVPSVIHWKLGHYAAIVRKVGDRYLVQDPTFRNDVWATEGALDAEASGYFLIPPGSLPGGWRTVDVSEGASVWGKGMTIGNDPGPICPMDPQTNPQACQEGMMVSTVHYMDVNLSLKDQPLGYTPPVGPPVKFTIRYNSRDAFQPANFTYANFGPLWTCDWIAYINDNPQSPLADVNYYAQGGGDRTFTGFEPTTQAFGYQQYDETLLTRTGTNSYQMLWPDGSKLIFAQPDGSVGSSRKVFLTQIVDPQGNAITLTYDSMLRLMAITDAIGQVTTLSYAITNQITNPGNYITNDSSASDYYPDLGDFYKITQVTDPFGRTAMFNYINPTLMQTRTIIYTYKPTGNDPPMTTNIVDNYHYWRLGSVTDVIGITSEVGEHIQLLPVSNSGSDTYYTNGHIATATLITNYVASESVVSLETPYGETDFDSGSTNTTRFLETTYPDGSRDRVEYNQTIPIPMNDPVASIPAGMNTQNDYEGYRNTFYWSRNACASSYGDYTKAKIYHWLHTFDLASTAGILESTKEALENRVWYDYAGQNSAYTSLVVGNNNQPTQVGRVLDDGSTQLHTYAYNGFGRLTNSVDPVGRTFSYLYNTNGIDLLEVFQTRAGNNDLLFKATYNSQHLPLTVTDAAGQTSTATYNSRGQITSVTDARNEATAFGYDTNGYLITIAGPLPGTNDTDTITYDGYGRPRSLTDTSGYTEIYDYDNLDRLTRITHPDGSFEQYTYDRMDLVTVQDRAGRQTSLSYDNMRQITRKTDPLGRVTLFEWCQCGTLKSMTDPLGHTTSWVTDVEDRKTAKQYSDGSQVRYIYENTSSRLQQVIDEKQQATVFAYYPDNTIQSVSCANAAAPTPRVNYTYDSNYKRVATMMDGIGITTYEYYPPGSLGALKPATVSGPWPNENVTYTYDELGRPAGRSLDGVAESVSRDALGRVTNSIDALGVSAYAYDGASPRPTDVIYPGGQTTHLGYFNNTGDFRLQQMTHRKANAALISQFTYAYDVVGNITTWGQQLGSYNETWTAGYDAADRLAMVSANIGGTNVVPTSYTYDAADNRLTEKVNGTSTNSQFNSLNELVSVANPNLTNATYQWDGLQRLTAIVQATNRSQFSYDGTGHLCRVLEIGGDVTNCDRRFVWCGNQICEERDANNSIIRRFFARGEQSAGTNFYYFADHLGSIRELTDAASTIRAEYLYSPFGEKSKLQGDLESSFGFTRLLNHDPSSTIFAVHRVYSPGSGRWLSRDPIGEMGGQNLFGYTGQNPIKWIDPLGYDSTSDLNNVSTYTGYVETSLDFLAMFNSDSEMLKYLDIGVGDGLAVFGALSSVLVAFKEPTQENKDNAVTGCVLAILTIFPPTSEGAAVISLGKVIYEHPTTAMYAMNPLTMIPQLAYLPNPNLSWPDGVTSQPDNGGGEWWAGYAP